MKIIIKLQHTDLVYLSLTSLGLILSDFSQIHSGVLYLEKSG